MFGNYEAFFLCLLTLVLFLVPTFIEVNFSISIPETLEAVSYTHLFEELLDYFDLGSRAIVEAVKKVMAR